MMRVFVSGRLTTGLLLLALVAGKAWAADDPQALIRNTADRVLAEVTTHREELEADNSGIYLLVEDLVVPHFDFRRMSRSALGRHWRKATEDQKQRLAYEFKEMLVRTYAIALLSYSGQQIQYLPVRYKDNSDRVMIPTKVNGEGGLPVPVNYRLRKTDKGWLVYDVIIDGVSLVSNYRSTFTAEVRRGGIDGLIQTLAERNKKKREG